MKNKVIIFAVILISVMHPIFSQTISPVSCETNTRQLSFITLMEEDISLIEELIESADEDAYFQLGILNINHIIITDNLTNLNDAVKNLDLVPDCNMDEPLYLIYKGMSEAFLARSLTIFGIPSLKRTADYMTSVPDNYQDWYIRLLRGMAFYNLGSGLPEIGPLKETREQALTTGKQDLIFILDEHSRSSSGPFNRESYDWDNYPVPDNAADFALEVLSR